MFNQSEEERTNGTVPVSPSGCTLDKQREIPVISRWQPAVVEGRNRNSTIPYRVYAAMGRLYIPALIRTGL